MKLLILTPLLLAASFSVNAQFLTKTTVRRNVNFNIIGKDSVMLGLNENYELIEDSCSVITMRGHLDVANHKLKGHFKDVSKLDPTIIVAEGNYGADGLKNGLFTSHYINGNLRSTGAYKNNRFDGKWEINYEDGKPAIKFEARHDSLFLSEYWDKSGKKIVDKGKGAFLANQGGSTWKGKIENGKPDGTWHLYRTDDASETSIIDETFKKGVFVKGSSPYKNYTDSSRINLIDPDLLPFVNTEKLRIAPPCNSVATKHIINAQYDNGLSSFSIYISDAARPVISRFNISQFRNKLTMTGFISEKGDIIDLQAPSPFDYNLANALTRAMRSLPLLHPATVDGKPVKQGFEITFTFLDGKYTFTYKFLPIKA